MGGWRLRWRARARARVFTACASRATSGADGAQGEVRCFTRARAIFFSKGAVAIAQASDKRWASWGGESVVPMQARRLEKGETGIFELRLLVEWRTIPNCTVILLVLQYHVLGYYKHNVSHSTVYIP